MKKIIVNESEKYTRIAVLENNKLTDFSAENISQEKLLGNIYKGKIKKVMPEHQTLFVEVGIETDIYLSYAELIGIDITKIKKGDMLIVQVSKESIGNKCPKGTMDLSFTGKYLVFMPNSRKSGISQKITDKKERWRLKSIGEYIKTTFGGVILRTESQYIDEKNFLEEAQYLYSLFVRLQEKARQENVTGLLYKDMDIVLSIMRDSFSKDVESFYVDSNETFLELVGYAGKFFPDLASRIKFYNEKLPVFDFFGIEKQIEKYLRTKIYLKSGAYLLVQEAETLCAIDVNSGYFKGKKNPEDTALAVNLEAAAEIAKILRIRNIGGIIVCDFINMKNRKNNFRLLNTLREILAKDRNKTELFQIREMGLICITRQRKRESILTILSSECPHCYGLGRIKT